MDLENILKEYFHCEKPFDEDGNLTDHGAYHKQRLVSLLHDLESIGIIHHADSAEERIDEIVNEDTKETYQLRAEYIHDIRAFVDEESDYELPNAFEGVYKDGRKVVFRWLGFDHDTEDLFCIISKEPDETNCVMLSDLTLDSLAGLYEFIVEAEIERGWDWKGHAKKVLNETFTNDELEDKITDFATWYWNDLLTDADNIRAFKEYIEEQ